MVFQIYPKLTYEAYKNFKELNTTDKTKKSMFEKRIS